MAIREFEFERMLSQELGVWSCNLYAGKLALWTQPPPPYFTAFDSCYVNTPTMVDVTIGFVTGSHDSCVSHNQLL